MNKNIILILLSILAVSSCKKKVQSYRYFGYIYNSIDSTPYDSKNFKLWQKGGKNVANPETPFTTNCNGYFSVQNIVLTESKLAWPSFDGSTAYVGPIFPEAKSKMFSISENANILNFDTIYIKPYH
jgi:hypothetical protein